MKNTIKVLAAVRSIAIIAAILVIGFSMAGCKNDPSPGSATYTGIAGDVTYTLKITQAARYTVQGGDSYVLTVGGKTSSGTVVSFTVGTGIFILKPSGGTATFTVTVNSSGGITNITGTIIFTDGTEQDGPGELTTGGGDPTVVKVTNEAVTLPDGAPTTIDFSFYPVSESEVKPLSEFITGTPKVQITNGKLTLELDAPKNTALVPFDFYPETITITPSDAKVFVPEAFFNSTGTYFLYMKGPGTHVNDATTLGYVDKDVTINGIGTYEDEHTETYTNVTFKKGWNYMSGKTDTSGNCIYTASQTKPSDATWTVVVVEGDD